MKSSNILIHACPQYGQSISASPFPIRLELFLRWAKIPYSITTEDPTHPYTQKTPWIEYKEKHHADSGFILEMFSKDFDLDIDSHLSAHDRGVSRMVQRMLGEGSLFCNFAWRFHLSDNGKLLVKEFLGGGVKVSILGMLAVKRLRKYMWGQGISRLSYDQILKLYYDDLQALSDFLDEKPYLMGDKLSSSDCLAYPFMEIIHSTLDSSQGNPIKDFMLTLPNLNEYRLRIQKEYFPDWEVIVAERKVNRVYNP